MGRPVLRERGFAVEVSECGVFLHGVGTWNYFLGDHRLVPRRSGSRPQGMRARPGGVPVR